MGSNPNTENKNNNKKGLVEWLKFYALNSSPSTTKKKKGEDKYNSPSYLKG
jgi:hypothetical protein